MIVGKMTSKNPSKTTHFCGGRHHSQPITRLRGCLHGAVFIVFAGIVQHFSIKLRSICFKLTIASEKKKNAPTLKWWEMTTLCKLNENCTVSVLLLLPAITYLSIGYDQNTNSWCTRTGFITNLSYNWSFFNFSNLFLISYAPTHCMDDDPTICN